MGEWMNTDLIGSIELTASAAIIITALSIGFGYNAATRLRVAVGLSLWFVLVVILAATRALYYEHGLGAHGLGIAVTLPIAVLCLVVARTQSLREGFSRVPLWLLTGVHTVRLLGISFIILYAAHRLPAPFAPVAGWGDIFVGAGPQRLIFTEPSSAIMTTLPWLLIPGFLVPLLFAVHIGIFVRLAQRRLISDL